MRPVVSRFEELIADACRAAREEFEARTAQAMASNVRDRLLAEAWEARPGEVTWNSLLRRLNEALPVAGRVRYGTLRKWVRDGSAGVRGRGKGERGRDEQVHGVGREPGRGDAVAPERLDYAVAGDPGA